MSNEQNSSGLSRIEQLLDEHSFVELGALVTSRSTDFQLTKDQTPSDGVVTGYGLVEGRLVYVFSQDASVLQGTIGEMHAKKILAVYEMAMKMGAPVIGLIDCAGVRLQESVDALESMGSIFAKAAAASGVIPQIMGVFGPCGGGLSLLTAAADFVFLSEDSRLFLNSPDAIDKNRIEVLDTSAPAFQYAQAGNADFVGTNEQVFERMRQLLMLLPSSNLETNAPGNGTDDLNRASEGMEDKLNDTAAFAREIADDHLFVEVKAGYGCSMVTGLLRLSGMTVGVVGNRRETSRDGETVSLDGVLTAEGCEKAAGFINFCDAFDIPVLSLTNVNGYEATVASEKRLPRAAARMMTAFAGATVPKINFIIGEAIGSAYLVMNAKSLGADLVYAYANTHVAPMDEAMAARLMCQNETAEVMAEREAEYRAHNDGVGGAARRGYVDRIVSPADTRKYLVAGFEMLFSKQVDSPYRKHGAK